jgi:hypothetical protein
MNTYNFSTPGHTQELWRTISKYWSHSNRPSGQRFLGSVQINQKATDQVLDVVGDNFIKLGTVTHNKLHTRFNDPEKNWLKILTFALSEYAYYYSSVEEKFWDGFCQKLKLNYSQSIENTLRKIAGEGFNLLGIVKAKGGYSYVSTLWLQSGIPQQNLNHFAQLVQEFSNEYGWWEIAHNPCEDIAEELFDFCQEKHPQWGTLINFLKASCSQEENEEVEPISGQLLQGIAIIAVELERQGTLPEALKNGNEREKLLGNYDLPNNFFLRDWNSLIQVLTPKQRRFGNSRKIISRRQKPLSLVLDVADSLNMRLVLPEQNLWKKGWERLGGNFCQIPAAGWEGTIPNNPGLMIPEQAVNIKSEAELWEWQLLDHRKNCLTEWKLEGITSDLPCLIFDAWTGDRLNLDSANPTIKGTEEIICFTPKGVQLNFGNGIEIIDSCVPSSLPGWQGQQLALTNKESSINLSFIDTTAPRLLKWTLSGDTQPSLRGLKIKGKKSVYLEIPSFWHPPTDREVSLNVSIEDITCRQIVINTTETVQASDTWVEIALDRWITKPGKYEVRFWNQSHRWSYRFEIQSNYQITETPEIKQLKVSFGSQFQVDKLPVNCDYADKFWATEIQIEGFYPLEIISLLLYDKQEKVFSQYQADSLGSLHINLASLYNLLPLNSNWFALDFKRLAEEPKCLIQMEVPPLVVRCIWDERSVQISGLLSSELYSLSCWNLLLPEHAPIEIKIPLIASNEDTIAVPLELQPGIYHIQLAGSRKLRQNLGWWCGSNQNNLPDKALENEDLENYCYTILDNKSISDFIKAAEKYDHDPYLLQAAIDSLKDLPFYLPEWLHFNLLSKKLQSLLQIIKGEVIKSLGEEIITNSKNENIDNIDAKINQQNWLLIKISSPKQFGEACKQIKNILKINDLQKEVLNISVPRQFNNILLLECKNVKILDNYIEQLECIQIIQPLTSYGAQKYLRG